MLIPTQDTYTFYRTTRNGFTVIFEDDEGEDADLTIYDSVKCKVYYGFDTRTLHEFEPFVDGNVVSHTFTEEETDEIFPKSTYTIEIRFKSGGQKDVYYNVKVKVKTP